MTRLRALLDLSTPPFMEGRWTFRYLMTINSKLVQGCAHNVICLRNARNDEFAELDRQKWLTTKGIWQVVFRRISDII